MPWSLPKYLQWVEWWPQKNYVHISIPRICRYDLRCKRWDKVQVLEMQNLSWIIQVNPKGHHIYPDQKDTEEHLIQTHRGEGGVKMEAEDGVMWPQAKER